MPTGIVEKIPLIMRAIKTRHQSHGRITSVLDIGIGWGKFGILCREYLSSNYDAMKTDEDDWEFRLDGVEICQNYIMKYIHALYTHVWPIDVRDFCNEPEVWIHPWSWDLVLMIDVLEHISKEDGHKVLQTLLEYTRWLVISVPTKLIPQNVKVYHPQEQHLCCWQLEDLDPYAIDEVIENDWNLLVILRGKFWEKIQPKR